MYCLKLAYFILSVLLLFFVFFVCPFRSVVSIPCAQLISRFNHFVVVNLAVNLYRAAVSVGLAIALAIVQ